MKSQIPPNAKLSANPLFNAKLAPLRDRSLPSHSVRSIVADLTRILAVEATSTSAAYAPIPSSTTSPTKVALIVVLRAGLAMCDPFLSQLSPGIDVAVYHLGLFRDKETLDPVEYFNKLPVKNKSIKHAIIVDPLIATGGTAAATIGILKDWGVEHITFVSILASKAGLERVANVWSEGTDILVGAVDDEVDDHGYIVPGVGDIGDRLFGTQI